MQPDTGWSTGQRALLRFLEQQGVLTHEPAAPAVGRPSNADLFAAFADAIDQQALVDLVSQALRIAAVDLREFEPMSDLAALIPVDVARRGEVVPIAQYDGTLEVAAANPLDLETVKSVEFTTGLRVRTKIARRSDVCRAICDAYGADPAPAPEAPAASPAEAAPEAPAVVAEPAVAEEAPVGESATDAAAVAGTAVDGEGAWSFEIERVDSAPERLVQAPAPASAPIDEPDPEAVLAWAVEETPDDEQVAEAPEVTAVYELPDPSEDDDSPDLGLDDIRELGLFDDVRLDDPAVVDGAPEDALARADADEASEDATPDPGAIDVEVAADRAVGSGVTEEGSAEVPSDSASAPLVEIADLVEVADADVVAAPTGLVTPSDGAPIALERPAVLVVSRDLSRRVALREALEQGAGAPCVLTMRDEVEARAVLGLDRIAAVVVEGGALASDGQPLWEVLRARASGVVVWGGRPQVPDVVGLDRDTSPVEVAARVRALLEETVDD